MQIRILVIDEAAFVRDALKRSVRRFLKEVEVFDAVNGKRALPILRNNKISMVISEWELPEMSGFELLKWMREDEGYTKTPFIVMSDGSNRNMVMDAVKSGASDFMTKPFSPDEVQKKVVKQLARIGFKAKPPNPGGLTSGLGALTGNAPKAKLSKPSVVTAAAGFGKPAPQTKAGAASFSGTAHLHFGDFSSKCDIRELSLTGLSGLLERSDTKNPSIFEEATADIENAKGEPIGQLKVYIHALHAVDPNPLSKNIKITLRFADNEPEKFEQLSKAIAKGS